MILFSIVCGIFLNYTENRRRSRTDPFDIPESTGQASVSPPIGCACFDTRYYAAVDILMLGLQQGPLMVHFIKSLDGIHHNNICLPKVLARS